MTAKTSIIAGKPHARVTLFAAVDPAAHHVEAKVGETRFAALLTLFRTDAEARTALIAAAAHVSRGEA
jgi:hypothetical protein